ncbi:MAG: gliding motility-associated C-terminal domain-containing protein, partial [Bacteroidia bacterium]|nr:gliding motility-associated C-terminal domain-containing protein [Bacteroidia bacterium]
TTAFQQNDVPLCKTNNIYVPGCSGIVGADYLNRNPFFYKFTCYASGTLGFLITPHANFEDYDWQLFDITGQNPEDIFTNNSLVVTGNWSGNYGPTGASASGVNFIQCASDPGTQNTPTFAAMPTLVAGHEYLLMVSHYTDSQSGYDLTFQDGSAIITDPAIPEILEAKPDCDGTKITVKLNKKIRCNSLTASGSEFSLLPAAATVIAATTTNCSSAFDFDEVLITLSSSLPSGNYQLAVNYGSDGNTLLDICGNSVAAGENISFQYASSQPILADSISRVNCKPDSVRIYFPKKIICSSIAPNGSDFSVTGPSPVSVIAANGSCVNGNTDYIVVRFATPIYAGGVYQLTLKTGTDGNAVIDECGKETPMQTHSFNATDTVSADFNYITNLGCRFDTLGLIHNGAHNVNQWNWSFNNNGTDTIQSPTVIFSASSGTNTIRLKVSNGVCTDSATASINLNNEVKASFEMPDFICPEDSLPVTNTSTGQIDSWLWKFDVSGNSTLKDPPPVHFSSNNNQQLYKTIKLIASNNMLNCSDSIVKTVRLINNCFIAVPTAFTPNGDGLNDFLSPNNALKADNLEFKVYNRWGQLVFASHNWQQKWNGTVKGVPQSTGVYVWFLRYTHHDTGKKIFQKGTVTLIR